MPNSLIALRHLLLRSFLCETNVSLLSNEAKELSPLNIVDCVCIELEVWVQLLSVTQAKLHADSFGSR